MADLADLAFVAAPLAGLAAVILLGLGTRSAFHPLFLRCRDPARRGFRGFAFTVIVLGIYAAIYLAQAIWLRLGDNSIETHQRLYNVMTLVRNIGYVRLFTMLVELGTGLRCTILTTRDNDKQGDKGREERFREITHGCLYTVAAVLYILTGAEFIGRIFLLSADSVPEVATLSSFVDVGIALHILLLVSFTLALVLMIYVFFLARRASLVGNIHKLLLAAAVLIFARALVSVGTDVLTLMPQPGWTGQSAWQIAQANRRRQYAAHVLVLIGDFVFVPIGVVLVFIAGRRKIGGIWLDQSVVQVVEGCVKSHKPEDDR